MVILQITQILNPATINWEPFSKHNVRQVNCNDNLANFIATELAAQYLLFLPFAAVNYRISTLEWSNVSKVTTINISQV